MIHDLPVQFKTGFLHLITELFLKKSLELSRWSKNTDSFTFLKRLSVKFEIPICSSALVKKMLVSSTLISSAAATTRITRNKTRTNFLIKGIFKTKQCRNLYGYWKTTIHHQITLMTQT